PRGRCRADGGCAGALEQGRGTAGSSGQECARAGNTLPRGRGGGGDAGSAHPGVGGRTQGARGLSVSALMSEPVAAVEVPSRLRTWQMHALAAGVLFCFFMIPAPGAYGVPAAW